MEYIPQVPGNRPEVGQNQDCRKAVSATFSVLESLWLEYIPQVSGNKREIGQNHDSLKTVSATLSVLK